MRLILYTGKGGVGKTTTAAASAVCAAEHGKRTLVLSADAAHSLGDVFERRIGGEPRRLAPRLDALEVDPRSEIERSWGSIRDYLVALFRYQGIEEVVAEELALLPGAEEIATLLAVEEYAAAGDYDVIVVDCAPTDATLRLVTLPEVARGALRLLLRVQRTLSALVTPVARSVVPVPLPGSEVFRDLERLIYHKLRRLRRRLSSPDTTARLVVTPERMVIDEARRALTDLCLFDVACDAVVMNRFLPEAAASEEFFRDWSRLQEERRREVLSVFDPIHVLTAPLQSDEVTGLERLSHHGREMFGEVEADAVLSRLPRVRFARDPQGYRVHLPLPGASIDALDVVKVGQELVVRAGASRRSLMLPPRIHSLNIREARFDRDELVVCFSRDGAS